MLEGGGGLRARHERHAILRRLRELSLFRDFDDDELGQIDGLMTEIDIEPGEHLTREGEVGREFVIIHEGFARVTKGGEEVAVVGPGSFVGEIALLDGTKRTATVTAITPLVAHVLGVVEFEGLLDAAPALREKIEFVAAQRRA